ncbi:hypothetical protein [Streptomyces afghaniensis]|uniref:hypothetical protein n=1 Tax=Streptomyces afghaniensis TaxID=66865 RepID=UPI00379558E8
MGLATFRRDLVALVRAGARFERGQLVERPDMTDPQHDREPAEHQRYAHYL